MPDVGSGNLPRVEGTRADRAEADVRPKRHGAPRSRQAVRADDAEVHEARGAGPARLPRAVAALPRWGIAEDSVDPAPDPRAPPSTVVGLAPVPETGPPLEAGAQRLLRERRCRVARGGTLGHAFHEDQLAKRSCHPMPEEATRRTLGDRQHTGVAREAHRRTRSARGAEAGGVREGLSD